MPIARRMEFLVSDNYNEFFLGIISKRFTLFLGQRKKDDEVTILARESDQRDIPFRCCVQPIIRFSKPYDSTKASIANCGKKKKRRTRENLAYRVKERLATFASGCVRDDKNVRMRER